MIAICFIVVGASNLYDVIYGRFFGGAANKEWYLKPPAAEATFHQQYCSEWDFIERCVRPDVIQLVILKNGLLANPTGWAGREAVMMREIPQDWRIFAENVKRLDPELQSAKNDSERENVFRKIADAINTMNRAWNSNAKRRNSPAPIAPVFKAIEFGTYRAVTRLQKWDGWKSDSRKEWEEKGVKTGAP